MVLSNQINVTSSLFSNPYAGLLTAVMFDSRTDLLLDIFPMKTKRN